LYDNSESQPVLITRGTNEWPIRKKLPIKNLTT
jgi:hypothetical protein